MYGGDDGARRTLTYLPGYEDRKLPDQTMLRYQDSAHRRFSINTQRFAIARIRVGECIIDDSLIGVIDCSIATSTRLTAE
jgi:hypothetical protein